MITVDRDIYLVLLGGAIGFLSSIGASITKYLFDVRLEQVKKEHEKIMKEHEKKLEEVRALRKKLSGDDEPELKRRLTYGTR